MLIVSDSINKWREIPPLNFKRKQPGCCVLSEKIAACIGGRVTKTENKI